MNQIKKSSFVFRSILGIFLLSGLVLQTGCASGGYQLTRKFSRIVNSQNIIIRIVLYIVIIPVYGITLAADAIIFNTMDFWKGTVSANSYNFEDNNKLFAVKNFYKGKLKNSEIKIYPSNKEYVSKPEKTILISQTTNNQIQVFVDGKLISQVDDINDIPKYTFYKDKEQVVTSPYLIADI